MAIFRRVPQWRRAAWFPRAKARFVPSLTPPADQAVDPGAGALTITGYAPRVAVADADRAEDASRETVFVHEVTLPNGTTFHVGTAALVGVPAVILDPGLVRQDAFSSGRTPGVIAPTYGDAVYLNVDGRFEALMMGIATDGAKVTCRYGTLADAYPAEFTVDFIAYVNGTPRFTKREVTLRLRDRTALFADLVADQGFDHALSDAAGTRRRRYAYGTPGYLQPILYIPFEVLDGNTWYVQRNTPNNLDEVFDGGVRLVSQGQAASMIDLFAGPPPDPSSYKFFSEYPAAPGFEDNEGTWIRLGSKVRVDLRYLADSPTTTITALAIAAGIADAADMEDGSVDLDVGSRVIEDQTFRDVFEDVARVHLSLIGFSRADRFMQRYLVPSSADDYDTDFTFIDGVNSDNWECYPPEGVGRRVWQVQVNAGATEKGQLAGIPDLDGTAAEALSRDRWLTSFVGAAATVKADDASAEPMQLDVEANAFAGDQAAMLAYVADLLALFGGVQVWTWLTAQYTPETAALQLMDRVALLSPEGRLTGGRRARIVAIERQLASNRLRFCLWTHFTTVDPEDVELTSVDDAATSTGATSRGSENIRMPESMVIACGNPDTVIETAGLLQDIPAFPYSLHLTEVSAALSTAQAGGAPLIVDVRVDGTSVFSVPVTFDNGETRSTDSATQPELTTFDIERGQRVSFYATQVGDGTAAGLKVNLVGYQ